MVDKFWDVFQWAGVVEGVYGDEVFKGGRFEFFYVFLYICRFVLENVNCFFVLKKFVGFGVVQWDYVYIEFDIVVLFCYSYCFFDDGQGFQIQEVYFKQAGIFCYVVVKLRDEYVGVFVCSYWYVVGDVIWCDDYFIGVYVGILDGVFKFVGCLDYLFDFVVGFG